MIAVQQTVEQLVGSVVLVLATSLATWFTARRGQRADEFSKFMHASSEIVDTYRAHANDLVQRLSEHSAQIRSLRDEQAAQLDEIGSQRTEISALRSEVASARQAEQVCMQRVATMQVTIADLQTRLTNQENS